MRLSALFEEFLAYLRVEREAALRTVQTYQWCFGDFMEFAATKLGGTVLVVHFDADVCRAYHYDLGARRLQTNSMSARRDRESLRCMAPPPGTRNTCLTPRSATKPIT